MMKILFFIVIIIVVWINPATAEVPDLFQEIVTYGSFSVTVNALERLGLLMSDGGFGTWVFIFTMLGGVCWAGRRLQCGVRCFLRFHAHFGRRLLNPKSTP